MGVDTGDICGAPLANARLLFERPSVIADEHDFLISKRCSPLSGAACRLFSAQVARLTDIAAPG